MSYFDELPKELLVEIAYTFDEPNDLYNFAKLYDLWNKINKYTLNVIIRQMILNRFPEFEPIIDDEYQKDQFEYIDVNELFKIQFTKEDADYVYDYRKINLIFRYWIYTKYPIFYNKIKDIKMGDNYSRIVVLARPFDEFRRVYKWAALYQEIKMIILKDNPIEFLYIRTGIVTEELVNLDALCCPVAYGCVSDLNNKLSSTTFKTSVLLGCNSICKDISFLLKKYSRGELILIRDHISEYYVYMYHVEYLLKCISDYIGI